MASGVGGNQSSSNRPLSFQENMQQMQKVVKIIEESSSLIAQAKACSGSSVIGKILKERVIEEAYIAKNTIKFNPRAEAEAKEHLASAARALYSLKTEYR